MDEPRLDDLLRQLSDSQLRYVQAAMYSRTIKEAAASAGIPASTVYQWPDEDRAIIEEAVKLARLDGVMLAREKMRRAAGDSVDALHKIVRGNSRNEKAKGDAATAILDRIGINPKSQVEVSGPGGTALIPIADLIAALRRADEQQAGSDTD